MMKSSISIFAMCCCLAVQAKPSGSGHGDYSLVGVPDQYAYGKLVYPHMELQDLGTHSHGHLPPKEIKLIRTIKITVPQPYPVKVPHKVPYPVHVAKPYPVEVTKIVKVPHPVPVEVIKSVPVPVEVPKPYPVPQQEYNEQQNSGYGGNQGQGHGGGQGQGFGGNQGYGVQEPGYDSAAYGSSQEQGQVHQGSYEANQEQSWQPSGGQDGYKSFQNRGGFSLSEGHADQSYASFANGENFVQSEQQQQNYGGNEGKNERR